MSSATWPSTLLLATVLVSAIACSSSAPNEPPPACTLIGCEDGLRVTLQPDSGWPAGDYRFFITADGARTTCRGALPLPPCASGRALACEPAGVVTIVESGCALPASAHGFAQIAFDPPLQPGLVDIAIERTSDEGDVVVVAEAHLTPDFRSVQPNGPDCPPVCTQAQAVMALGF